MSEYCNISSTAQFVADKRPWEVACDIAFPSATQNELNASDAELLVANGCRGVFEGANMPSTPDAIEVYQKNNVIFGPGKAANAGGVAVSGLEMAQNAQMATWPRDRVERDLEAIMCNIYEQCSSTAREYGKPNDLKFGQRCWFHQGRQCSPRTWNVNIILAQTCFSITNTPVENLFVTLSRLFVLLVSIHHLRNSNGVDVYIGTPGILIVLTWL